jgi:hypothetical protein
MGTFICRRMTAEEWMRLNPKQRGSTVDSTTQEPMDGEEDPLKALAKLFDETKFDPADPEHFFVQAGGKTYRGPEGLRLFLQRHDSGGD